MSLPAGHAGNDGGRWALVGPRAGRYPVGGPL